MSAWADHLVGVIEAIDGGIESHGGFGSKTIGPLQLDRLTYPAVHIVPQTVDYAGGNEYTHSITVEHIYTFTHDFDYTSFVLETAERSDSVLDALHDTDDLDIQARVDSVDHFAGQPADNLLVGLDVTFAVQTAVDLATYRD